MRYQLIVLKKAAETNDKEMLTRAGKKLTVLQWARRIVLAVAVLLVIIGSLNGFYNKKTVTYSYDPSGAVALGADSAEGDKVSVAVTQADEMYSFSADRKAYYEKKNTAIDTAHYNYHLFQVGGDPVFLETIGGKGTSKTAEIMSSRSSVMNEDDFQEMLRQGGAAATTFYGTVTTAPELTLDALDMYEAGQSSDGSFSWDDAQKSNDTLNKALREYTFVSLASLRPRSYQVSDGVSVFGVMTIIGGVLLALYVLTAILNARTDFYPNKIAEWLIGKETA